MANIIVYYPDCQSLFRRAPLGGLEHISSIASTFHAFSSQKLIDFYLVAGYNPITSFNINILPGFFSFLSFLINQPSSKDVTYHFIFRPSNSLSLLRFLVLRLVFLFCKNKWSVTVELNSLWADYRFVNSSTSFFRLAVVSASFLRTLFLFLLADKIAVVNIGMLNRCSFLSRLPFSPCTFILPNSSHHPVTADTVSSKSFSIVFIGSNTKYSALPSLFLQLSHCVSLPLLNNIHIFGDIPFDIQSLLDSSSLDNSFLSRIQFHGHKQHLDIEQILSRDPSLKFGVVPFDSDYIRSVDESYLEPIKLFTCFSLGLVPIVSSAITLSAAFRPLCLSFDQKNEFSLLSLLQSLDLTFSHTIRQLIIDSYHDSISSRARLSLPLSRWFL